MMKACKALQDCFQGPPEAREIAWEGPGRPIEWHIQRHAQEPEEAEAHLGLPSKRCRVSARSLRLGKRALARPVHWPAQCWKGVANPNHFRARGTRREGWQTQEGEGPSTEHPFSRLRMLGRGATRGPMYLHNETTRDCKMQGRAAAGGAFATTSATLLGPRFQHRRRRRNDRNLLQIQAFSACSRAKIRLTDLRANHGRPS